jgi:hypothetical protein
MAPKIVIAAVVFAGLLGCATPPPPPPPPPARADCGNSGACTIDVKVRGCTVTAPDIDVRVATNIFWELDRVSRDDGWSFPNDNVLRGIWIKDPPQGQFVLPDRQTEWKFKLHDKNDVKGTFRYGVRVVKGSIMCELDPSIVNH